MVPAWQESVRAIRSNPMAGIRTNSRLAADLLVELRRDAPDPLHRQISATIRDGIRSGRLGLGTSLPPTRTVAADLGVSRGGVPEVHEALAGCLNRARGTSAQPGNVVMCNGYAQGIALLIQVLAKSGAKRIAVADASSAADARPLAAAAGLGRRCGCVRGGPCAVAALCYSGHGAGGRGNGRNSRGLPRLTSSRARHR